MVSNEIYFYLEKNNKKVGEKNMEITILTPTYNRVKMLPKLYKSLLNQTSKRFEWLIIDDGSTDDTLGYINEIIKEKKINIRYYKKNNGGKHRAINYAMNFIKNDLTFIVDSDDWLINDAVEKILFYAKKYEDNKNIACFSFHRSFPNNVISGPHYKEKEFISNYIEYRINEHVRGEGAEVVFTNKLKEFPFIEIDGENFLSEGYLWISMAYKYQTVYIDESIYMFDYLEDGLTKNINKIRIKNPKGCVEVSKLYFNNSVKLIPKIKAIIKYIAYSKFAKYKMFKTFRECHCKILFLIFYLTGFFYYLNLRKNVRKKYEY